MAGRVDVAGVVDEHVDRTQCGLHAVEHVIHLLPVGHVGGDGERRADGLRSLVRARCVQVVNSDARPLGGKARGYGAADAVARSGDHHDLRGKLLHDTDSIPADWGIFPLPPSRGA